jgi:hypothetical protein
MKIERATWAAKQDRDFLQPALLGTCLLFSKTFEDGFKKFVSARRRMGIYVNMVVITPHLSGCADKISLWDNQNNFVGDIVTVNSLPQLVSTHLDRLNPNQPGLLRAHFPDDSMFEVPIPLTRLQINHDDPTSIEY